VQQGRTAAQLPEQAVEPGHAGAPGLLGARDRRAVREHRGLQLRAPVLALSKTASGRERRARWCLKERGMLGKPELMRGVFSIACVDGRVAVGTARAALRRRPCKAGPAGGMQGWQARPGWMLFALHASDKQAPAPLWLHACRAAPADIKRMPARGTGARHSQKWRT